MSASVGSVGYGLLPTLLANAGTVHSQLDTLTEQASTGRIAQTYAGLGTGMKASLTLGPQVAVVQTYQANIDRATGTATVAQSAMTQIQQIAQTFAADMPKLDGVEPSQIDSVASQARDALKQLAGLLDTKDGGAYVFGGQDTANPPVPNPDQILSSGFYTQINAAVGSLSGNGADATTAATLAVAKSNEPGTSPFSAYLSQPAANIAAPLVQTGENSFTTLGFVASANTGAVSSGASTSGSYMRDLMRSLATLGSMSSAQAGDPGFASLVKDTTASLSGAVDASAQDAGIVGDRQTQLTNLQTHLGDLQTALNGQVSAAQDVDMAATLSQLSNVQTQLQLSYRMIVNAGSLSLANYLPA